MVYLNRATCLSAALVALCVHTVTSFQAYSSPGSYSAPAYGSPSASGPSNERGSYGNYNPDQLYSYGGYVDPNDRRAPNYPAFNPIPQPSLTGGPLYPAHDAYSNNNVGKPFPHSGYPAFSQDTPYYPSGQPYPASQDTPYYPSGQTYPDHQATSYSPSGQTYPASQDKTYSPSGQTYPASQDKTYSPSGQTYPASQDKTYSPSGQTYPDHQDKPYYPSGQTYPASQDKTQSPSGQTYPASQDKTHSPSGQTYPGHQDTPYYQSGSQYPAPEPYSPKSSQYDNYPQQFEAPYPDHYPKSQVDYKPAPYPAVEPYPATSVDPYSPPGNYHANNPDYPSDQYTDKGYPVKQVQPPRKYHPVPAKSSLPSSLCDNCRFKNGVGYNAFPKSCQAYVTCQKYDGYKLLPTKMSCPYNLFWSQKLLTCVRPKNIKCLYDACARRKGGKTAPVDGNCAAYHVCGGYGQTSAIYCCAYGYRYQANYGYNKPGYQPCVKDHTCSDTCAPQKTPIRKERCRLFPVRGLATKYQELVHGKYVLRWCAPGSAFVHKDCGCTARVKVYPKRGCNAEVFIDFKHGIRDVSGNFVSVGNEWDRVKSVKASGAKDGFAGKFYNAQLILWRFANAPLGAPLKISFTFRESDYKKSGYGGGKEVLVSNGDCGKPASVSVAFDRSTHTVIGHIDTKHNKPVHVSVPIVPGQYQHVVYVHDGKYLTLSVNGKSKSVPAHGDAEVRQCALSLGGVKGSTFFNGLIDDFKLFLCTPKPVSPFKKVPYQSAPYGPRPGTYHAGNDYPTGPGPYRAANDDYPTGPGPYSAGKNDHSAGPGSYPAGPGSYPAGPGSYPAGPGSNHAEPGSYPAGPGSYPAGPGSYPAGPGSYPAGPGSNHAEPGSYPAGPGSYPAGPGSYPAGPGSYPAGKNRNEPTPY